MKYYYLVLAVISSISFSSETIPVAEKKFTLELSATRLVYEEGKNGVDITVYNKQQFPILVQSKVYKENRKDVAPFLVSPPLTRINQGQQTRLKLTMTQNEFDGADSEILYWLCVTGIPPKGGEWWLDERSVTNASINLNVLVNSCIKIFLRPNNLKESAHEYGWKLRFRRVDGGIEVINTTPYHINFSFLKIGGKVVSDISYIKPKSSIIISAPISTKDVSWRLINELGGETATFESKSIMSLGETYEY